MKVAFCLSMPSIVSWNGKWSGEGRPYSRVRTFPNNAESKGKAREIVAHSPYFFRWDDGWCAEVEAIPVDCRTATRMARHSCGFCGYDWMIDSIVEHGEIRLPER